MHIMFPGSTTHIGFGDMGYLYLPVEGSLRHVGFRLPGIGIGLRGQGGLGSRIYSFGFLMANGNRRGVSQDDPLRS